MISIEQVWTDKETGEEVVIDWVSSELVSYLKPDAEKLVRTVRKFVFLQQFDSDSRLVTERENDGASLIVVNLGDL